MWGIEHSIMAGVAFFVIGFLFAFRPFWAFCAALSQVPFWIGSVEYFLTNLDPVQRNLALDISMCGAFLLLAHITGKSACIFLCIAMFAMAILDIMALAELSRFYLPLHEVLHYAALAIALGGHRIGTIKRDTPTVRAGLRHRTLS